MESEGSDPGNSSGEGGCGGFLKSFFSNVADWVWLIDRVLRTESTGSLLCKVRASPGFRFGTGASLFGSSGESG